MGKESSNEPPVTGVACGVIYLRFPRKLKGALVRRVPARLLEVLAVLYSMSVLIPMLFHAHLRMDFYLFPLIIDPLSFAIGCTRPWSWKLSKTQLSVSGLGHGITSSLAETYSITWAKSVLIGIEPVMVNDLPAVRLHVISKHDAMRGRTWKTRYVDLAYEPEDEPFVLSTVLPALEAHIDWGYASDSYESEGAEAMS